MAIFYWINQGRLGNLLFQYAAIIRNVAAGDSVYSFHNEAFDLLSADPRFHVIGGRGRISRSISYRVNKLLRRGQRVGMLGCIRTAPLVSLERHEIESGEVVRTAGALTRVFVVDGFFQDGRLRDVPIQVKPALEKLAIEGLNSLACAKVKVAVHIRLTDYGHWSVYGVPGVLIPPEWYRERINHMRRRLVQPQFVIFSDDIAAARKLLVGDDIVYFTGASALEDFAVMSLCDHAVMSPSTFTWWSAFAHPNPGKILMAPEYWAGFKSRSWFPACIKTDGIEYYPAV